MIIPKIFGSTIPKLKAPVALNSAPLNKSSGTIPWPLLGIAGEGPLGKVTALTMHSHLYSQKKELQNDPLRVFRSDLLFT